MTLLQANILDLSLVLDIMGYTIHNYLSLRGSEACGLGYVSQEPTLWCSLQEHLILLILQEFWGQQLKTMVNPKLFKVHCIYFLALLGGDFRPSSIKSEADIVLC